MCSTRQRLAALLREQREFQGLSLRQAAARARLSPSTLSRWEAGTYLPRIPELGALLRALGLEADDVTRILVSLDAPRAVRAVRTLHSESGIAPSGGALLRALRKKSRKSLVEISLKLGVSASTVSRWEASEAHPSAKTAEQLMDFLEATPDERACLIASGVAKIHAERPPFNYQKFRDELDGIESTLSFSGDGGTELRLLQLQALLWWWSREPNVLDLLAQAHLVYARFLLAWERYPEAATEAETAVGSGFLDDFLASVATRVIAKSEVFRWETPRPHLGLYSLQLALQRAIDNRVRAGILTDMSEFSLMAHRLADAAGYAERAVVAANLASDELAQKAAREALRSAYAAGGRSEAIADPDLTSSGNGLDGVLVSLPMVETDDLTVNRTDPGQITAASTH